MKTLLLTLTALVAALALATTAYAQNSTVGGYNDEAGQVQTQVQGGGGGGGSAPGGGTTVSASGESGGSLPFTGLDVALLVGAGGLLLAVGVGMRRLTRAPEST
jgi:hypothetical protein